MGPSICPVSLSLEKKPLNNITTRVDVLVSGSELVIECNVNRRKLHSSLILTS